MKFFRAVSRLLLCSTAVGLAGTGSAQTLMWSNPQGSVTLFGSGARTTFLQTNAMLDGVSAMDSLNYLDASSTPAVSRSDATKDSGATFSAVAQLSVGESQTTGLPAASGGIGFSSMNGGAGTGSGAITLYYLIHVPSPAMIELNDIRSTITTAGSPASAFSLNLFQSDASGGKFGNAVLSYAGSYFDVSGSYRSSQSYYLLEMEAAANATLASSDSVDFSYMLDLTPAAAVPEPAAAVLLPVAIIAGLALGKASRKRGRS